MTPFFVSPRRLYPAPDHCRMPLPPLEPDPSMEQLMAQTGMYWYSVDYRAGRFRYVSPGVGQLLGYTADAWLFAGPRKIFKYVHPEDQDSVERMCAEIRREICRHPAKNRDLITFAFTCRVLDTTGKYLHLKHNLTFPRLDPHGNPLTDFVVVTDITALQSPHPCILHVRRSGRQKVETVRVQIFSRAEDVDFSRREIEVLQLVAEGCSSQEISQRLFISYNTVCTHRKNLLKKAGVNRTVDLLRYARSLGLVG